MYLMISAVLILSIL